MTETAGIDRRTRLSRGWRSRLVTLSLVGPPVGWLVVFFLGPVAIVAAYSVGLLTLFPGDALFTLDSWRSFLGGSVYLGLFWKSVRMSLIVSTSVVLLAYPIAYYLAFGTQRRKYVLLLVILAPFFTSYFLRVLAWKVILGDQGVINSFVFWLGLRDPDYPIPQLLYSRFTVMLVLAYVWAPFVALPIFVSLESMDRRLLEAASDLGAGRWKSFWKITFPLSVPGVIAAFVFVFIPSIGEFVTPLLVGGTDGFMFGSAINDLFGPGFDWRTGSVLAIFLLAVVGTLIAIFSRFVRIGRVGA